MLHKNLLLAASALMLIASLSAQTTVQDWTKTDCNGNSHQLFSSLDNGKIVLMDFVMLGCGSCITGSAYVEQIYQDYNLSHPGKVEVYAMSYNNIATCPQMSSWENTYGFSFPAIINCESDVNYYGGMGMPTVVLAGPNHNVIYKTIGWTGSSDTDIRNAIDAALNTNTIKNEKEQFENAILIHEHGKNHLELKLSNANNTAYTAEIIDIYGKTLLTFSGNLASEYLTFNLPDLANGFYIVRFSNENKNQTFKFLIMN